MQTIIYTDGSCLVNPNGPGGWAFVLQEKGKEWHVSGGCSSTTNNRMELTAIIEALNFCSDKRCTVYTDSMWCLNCAKGTWKRKKNLDLWSKYDNASNNRVITWVWVKGHSTDRLNNVVDELARNEAIIIKEKRKKS